MFHFSILKLVLMTLVLINLCYVERRVRAIILRPNFDIVEMFLVNVLTTLVVTLFGGNG